MSSRQCACVGGSCHHVATIPERCDVQTLSRCLDISPRRVQQLVKAGVIPRGKRGEYELQQCLHSYIRHLHELLYGFSGRFWTRGRVTDRQERRELITAASLPGKEPDQLTIFEKQDYADTKASNVVADRENKNKGYGDLKS